MGSGSFAQLYAKTREKAIIVAMKSSLALLTQINLDDLVTSFGWEKYPRLGAALRSIFFGLAQKFAAQMLAFDAETAQSDLTGAARKTLPHFISSLRIDGAENLPAHGPLLILSNHPGLADTLCLFAAIQRPDLRVLALNRPFLQALPNVSQRLFSIDDAPAQRMRAVRQTAMHLKEGGAVLTFPAGEIEPDADVYDGAQESLARWTDSAGVFLRFAPQTQVVPALVRGVLWDKAVKHPLTSLKRERFERERLGAALQLLAHLQFDLNPVNVSLQFGPPLSVETLGSSESRILHEAVLSSMRQLLRTKNANKTQIFF
jgi:hypothetical protein